MDMAKDPVCGMMVDEATAKWKSEHQGKTYYFCNERCKKAFDKAPSRFVRQSPVFLRVFFWIFPTSKRSDRPPKAQTPSHVNPHYRGARLDA